MHTFRVNTTKSYILLLNVAIETSVTSNGGLSLWITKENAASQIQMYSTADVMYQDAVWWFIEHSYLLAQFRRYGLIALACVILSTAVPGESNRVKRTESSH